MQELPTELLGCVFAFLPTVSLASVRLVCTRWLAIADEDTALAKAGSWRFWWGSATLKRRHLERVLPEPIAQS